MATLLIDGNNLAYRAKYTFSLSYRGQDVSVLYGFLRILLSYTVKQKPSSIIVCWDGGTPRDRKEAVSSYKSNRVKKEDMSEFFTQLDSLRKVLPSMGMVSAFARGVEADDLLFHASKILLGDCTIVTTDGDLAQAITPDNRVQVFHPLIDKNVTWDNFVELVGVPPQQFLDYKVLMGDSSDNLKGVPGIGESLAKKVLGEYRTVEEAWLSAVSSTDEWRSSKLAKTRLSAVNEEYLTKMRSVMDLTEDKYDSSDTVINRSKVWMKYDHGTVKTFMLHHGFHSLLKGEHRRQLQKLAAPVFLADGENRVVITSDK